jgi:hypothetical protein
MSETVWVLIVGGVGLLALLADWLLNLKGGQQ